MASFGLVYMYNGTKYIHTAMDESILSVDKTLSNDNRMCYQCRKIGMSFIGSIQTPEKRFEIINICFECSDLLESLYKPQIFPK